MADRREYSNGPAGYYGGDENTYGQPVYEPDGTRNYEDDFTYDGQDAVYDRPATQYDDGNGYGYGAGNGGYPYDPRQYPGRDDYGSGNAGYAYDQGQYAGSNGYAGGNGYDPGYGYNGGYQPAAQPRSGPSMAARAAGKANTELYGRRQQPVRRPAEAAYAAEEPPQSRKRRRRHHPFRNFLIFLLILILLVAGGYFLLFRAPEQTQADGYTRKSDFYNILLCATDEDGERTDSIMLLSLDKRGRTVSLTSLPRDTLLKSGEKLNSVYYLNGGGETGAQALEDTVKQLLGFYPDGYAIISYQAFRDAVDAMGGVKFDVPMDMTVDYANNDDDDVFIQAGEQVLDGDTALRVVRYRYGYAMADIQRVYVQQSFLKAMIRQCLSPTKWIRLPAVYKAVMDNTITDLSGAQLRYIALWTMLSYQNGVQQNTLPGEGVTYNGASCYALYSYNVVDMINTYMNPYEEEITWDDVSIYSVSDGQLVPDTTRGTAFDASTYTYN